MAHIGIYLTDDKNKTFELPVNPAELMVAYATDDATEQVVKLGEINRIGEVKLRQISIQSVLPVETSGVHYVTASKPFKTAQDYINRLTSIHASKKPLRLVLSGSKISIKMTIASFEYGFQNGNSDEYVYTLKLTEYKAYQAQKLKIVKKKVAKKGKKRPAPPKKIGRGSKVRVNGRLHLDSYGSGPGQTERNAIRRISIVANGRAYPYHVVTLSGGWRGWVKKSAVKAV
ncbi:hypothetical protein RA086_05630 [Lactiplantibacillus sp. WILCCON 0030]|uniref:Phage protein n=1 Tax=Lactiplantibacillus brownii TaxID=3069269 RepID=A0ABU1A879_9LACO|nr:hypothetical protein [Lactiplantibacillus brownii]MDQ7937107.1 hypothetical protein [Lactiplantibacillus brownii]